MNFKLIGIKGGDNLANVINLLLDCDKLINDHEIEEISNII
jgi:hypothetical protein